MTVISSPYLPPRFPLQDSLCSAKLLMAGRLWQGTDPPVLSCVCPWTFLTGHLWKQGSGLPELLVRSIKAVSVISSVWLWLVRAAFERDLLSATSQAEGSASALHWPLLTVVLFEQMKRRQVLQFLSLSQSSIKRLYWKWSLCLHVVGFLFGETLLKYCLKAPASRAGACEQTPRDPQPLLWFLPPSAFSHMKNCRECIASLSFFVYF